jgi:hypothetical protein
MIGLAISLSSVLDADSRQNPEITLSLVYQCKYSACEAVCHDRLDTVAFLNSVPDIDRNQGAAETPSSISTFCPLSSPRLTLAKWMRPPWTSGR